MDTVGNSLEVIGKDEKIRLIVRNEYRPEGGQSQTEVSPFTLIPRPITSKGNYNYGDTLNSDIFLQLSLCEGNSYATLDALVCGVPVVSSDVGIFYKDVPEDCFVKIDWRRNNDLNYIEEKLNYAWENKEILSKKGREWYLNNCQLDHWISVMRHTIFDNI